MILSALRTGWLRVASNLRLVALAWAVNTGLALLVAIPFLNQLESYLSSSVRDEEILARLNENWLNTFQQDMRASPHARLLDESILGAAPFIHHLDGMLSGRAITSLSDFLWDSLAGLEFASRHLTLLVLLSLAYSIGGMFLSGGFINAYASMQPVTISEFVSDASRFFGRFVRIGLLGFIFLVLVLSVFGPWVRSLIADSTANDASEWLAYVLYLAVNAILLVMIWILTLVLDYTRVRVVLEERASVLAAFGGGLSFLFRNWRYTFGVSLLLVLVIVLLMGGYGAIAESVTGSSYATLVFLFLVQQAYMIARLVVRASTYACEVELFRTLIPDEDSMHPHV